MNNDAIEETSVKIAEQNNFQFYDKIQKAILSDLFSRFRTIYPKRDIEFNHDFPIKEINKEINGEEYALTTYFTYEFIDQGSSEFIKLKTAFDPESELLDRAIISKLKEENEDFYTASIEREDLEEIELVDNPDEIINQHFDNYAHYQDDLVGDEVGIPLYFLGKSSRSSGIKVVLVGEGSDELFYGYDHWNRLLKLSKYKKPYSSVSNKFSKLSNHRLNLLSNMLTGSTTFAGGALGFNLAEINKLVSADISKPFSSSLLCSLLMLSSFDVYPPVSLYR